MAKSMLLVGHNNCIGRSFGQSHKIRLRLWSSVSIFDTLCDERAILDSLKDLRTDFRAALEKVPRQGSIKAVYPVLPAGDPLNSIFAMSPRRQRTCNAI